MAEITIEIDSKGEATTTLQGFETESPKIAAIFEAVLGKVEMVDWKPKAHNHIHLGHGHGH